MVMTPHMKWGIAGVIIALVLFGFIPWYIPVILLVIAIAVPAIAYRMLTPEQRRRVRQARQRKQLGN
jgi:hypothetical protein